MKSLVTALVALSILTGATLSALAAEEYDFPNDVFKNIERHLP